MSKRAGAFERKAAAGSIPAAAGTISRTRAGSVENHVGSRTGIQGLFYFSGFLIDSTQHCQAFAVAPAVLQMVLVFSPFMRGLLLKQTQMLICDPDSLCTAASTLLLWTVVWLQY